MGESAMKSRRSTRAALLLAAAATLSLRAGLATAATEYWNDGSSTWNSAANWSSSSNLSTSGAVPGSVSSSDVAYILNSDANSRTITLDTSETLANLYISNTNANGLDTLSQTSALAFNLTMTSELIGGSISFGSGTGGNGVHTQSSGTNTYSDYLSVGDATSSTGIYNLSGGTINITGTAGDINDLLVGTAGAGTFNQSSTTAASAVNILNGSLLLGNNAGSTGNYYLGTSAALSVSGNEVIGVNGNGNFTQSGGSNTLASGSNPGYMEIGDDAGNSAYTLTSGALTVNGSQYVATGATGAFTQSGGTDTVTSNLFIGYGTGSKGTVTLSGTGSLLVNGNAYIGGNTSTSHGLGTLNINGGSMNVVNTLKVYSTGSLNLNGGVLNAGTVDLTSGAFSAGGGTLIVSGGQLILPAAGKTFGDGSTSSTLQLHNAAVTSGPLTIANHSTFTGSGSTTTLLTVSSGGTLAPGENGPGIITASGGITLSSGSIFSLDLGTPPINGGTAGKDYDQVSVTGGVFSTGGATLSLNPFAGAVTGQTYPVVVTNGGSINYTAFSNLSGTTYTNGSTTAQVTYVTSPTPQIDVTFTHLPSKLNVLQNTPQTWGYNSNGQLGNGNTTNSTSPVTPTGLNGGVTAVAAGDAHSLAIQNGGLYAWGSNSNGQLGNNSTTDSHTPVAVSGLTSGVTAVAAGYAHSLAIQNGGLFAWGLNSNGQLGNGNTTQQNSPVAISSLSSGVTAVAAGNAHSLAIENGVLYAWGENFFGQLGIGGTTQQNSPVAISSLSSGVTAVAAGGFHSLAIQNGGLYAWGDNNYGQLGNGNTTQQNTPVNIFPQASGTNAVTAVAAGYDFTLAVKGGKVYAWGDNTDGQLGSGTTNNSDTPTLVDPNQLTGLQLTSIVAVAAGEYSSYALSSDGSLWVWGFNGAGELGLGYSSEGFYLPQHLLPPAGETYTAIDSNADGQTAIAILAPEPSSLSLLAFATLPLLRRRREVLRARPGIGGSKPKPIAQGTGERLRIGD